MVPFVIPLLVQQTGAVKELFLGLSVEEMGDGLAGDVAGDADQQHGERLGQPGGGHPIGDLGAGDGADGGRQGERDDDTEIETRADAGGKGDGGVDGNDEQAGADRIPPCRSRGRG